MDQTEQPVYLGVIGALFGLAIIMTAARTAIRVHRFRRLFVDDYFLFLAVACLIASTGTFFWMVPSSYTFSAFAVVIKPSDFKPPGWVNAAILRAHVRFAFQGLSWTTVFAVKLSFLFFFRNLIKRQRDLKILWWCVLIICIPVGIVCVCFAFIECLYVGNSVLEECSGMVLGPILVFYTVSADIGTDVLVISISILLLWKTRFNIGKKLSIGVVLCLSVVMIAIGLFRGISARYIGFYNPIWNVFWLQIESCVSVMMVCVTAFRTLIVSPRPLKNLPRSFGRLSYKQKWWREKRKGPELPEVPICATMTGMRTMIRENGRTNVGSFGSEDPIFPGKDQEPVPSSHENSTLAKNHEKGPLASPGPEPSSRQGWNSFRVRCSEPGELNVGEEPRKWDHWRVLGLNKLKAGLELVFKIGPTARLEIFKNFTPW